MMSTMIEAVRADACWTWRVISPMTQVEAANLLVAGQKLLIAESNDVQLVEIDLGAVDQADSSALAVLLDWLRTARQQGREMCVAHIPRGLRSLAELYGIQELLNLV